MCYIDTRQLETLAGPLAKSTYGQYLLTLVGEHEPGNAR